MTSKSIVRVASGDDFDEVWRLLLMVYGENAMFQLSPRKAKWHVERVLFPERIPASDTGPRGVIGVIGPKDRLEAVVFLIIGSFWYTEELHLEELTLFVDPEHRKSDHAKALIAWMKSQVPEVGLPLFTGIISNTRTEAKCRLYGRMLPKVGEFFFVRPNDDMLATSAGNK